tara:strand:+ start:897 stop:1208 length:312 start_codon:yes stop_codon:yes gene_type:complete
MADQIKKTVSHILLKEYTKITNSIITVTKVKVTNDLKLAKIYISIFNNKDHNSFDDEFNNIKNNLSNLRYHLGMNLQSKYVPKIQLFKDNQYDLLDKINKLNK